MWDRWNAWGGQDSKHREFWDTLCRLSYLTALQLEGYNVPREKETSLSDLDYPAGRKSLKIYCISLSGSFFSGMLSAFPKLESLKSADCGSRERR